VLAAIGERYYKVTAEALRVCGELVKAIRPNFDTVRTFYDLLVIVFHVCTSVNIGVYQFVQSSPL
jgi:hypothetical protein